MISANAPKIPSTKRPVDRTQKVWISPKLFTVKAKSEDATAFQLGLEYFPEFIEVHTERTGKRLLYALESYANDADGKLDCVVYKCSEYGFTLTVYR